MKKSVLVLILLFAGSLAYGQDVAILHDENVESYRKIQTDYTPLAKKGMVEHIFSLQYFAPTGHESAYYAIIFKIPLGNSRQSLPMGSKLYIKLEDDSIVKLKTISDIEDFDNTYEYLATLYCTYYYMFPIYYATPEQIEQLMTHRVVKIRRQVTWGQGYYDIPDGKVFKDKHLCFSENLMRMKLSIDERLNSIEQQDDLLYGF